MKDKEYNQIMEGNSMTINQAAAIIDDMYQDKFKIMEQKTETGVKIDLGKMDDIQFTILEFASVRLLREVQSLSHKLKKQEKENTDLKELYIRTAKHQEKIGHVELAEYMLAQIEAVPTLTTWEEYTTWVSKDSIRKILDKYKTKEIDFAPEFYKEIKELLEEK